ncbi:ketose 1,6-bisphosphate aldolase [Treponema sp.]
MSDTGKIVLSAYKQKLVVPAFNIPYLPMMEPVVRALRDMGAFGLIQVARLEWEKFESKSLEAVRDEYEKLKDERFMRLHLDHVPVIDEDDLGVDYEEIIERALKAGYQSVMVDGSRLDFKGNVEATRKVIAKAHKLNVAVEAELGAVLGHEAGPLPPYEELFKSGKGFTRPEDAERFVAETGVDWLSVSIGNIHGAISASARKQVKVQARLDIERVAEISKRCGIPLVLHGGSGIMLDCILDGIQNGIAKINIGTAIRKPYEDAMDEKAGDALERVYVATVTELENLKLKGSAAKLLGNLA